MVTQKEENRWKEKGVKSLLKALEKSHDKKEQRKTRRQLRKLGHEGGLGEHCDERCWNAKSDKCTCICNGKNHGKHRKE